MVWSGSSSTRCLRIDLLINTFKCALNGEVVLEFNGDLLPCEGLESREYKLQVALSMRRRERCSEQLVRVSRLRVRVDCFAAPPGSAYESYAAVPTICADDCMW